MSDERSSGGVAAAAGNVVAREVSRRVIISVAVPLSLAIGKILLLPLLILGAAVASTSPNPAALCAGQTSGQTFGAVSIDDGQLGNASTIVSVTARRDLPAAAAIVAMTAAFTDSALRGAPASSTTPSAPDPAARMGLFNQPVASYTAAVAGDPVKATNAFLDKLVAVSGWQETGVGAAAQAVQQSKFPERYQPNAGLAEQIVSQFWARADAGSAPSASTSAAPVGSPPADPEGDGAGTPLGVTGPQVVNARIIIAAAKSMGLPQRAGAIGIMTARQETTLRVLSNPTVPGSDAYPNEGTGSDPDSIGLFQQRPSMGWGTVEQLMDPGYASTRFFQALMRVPNWQSLPMWEAAQQVQASMDGTLYQQWEPLGTAVAAALWSGTTSSLICNSTPNGTTVGGPGGAFTPEACSIVPDPTTGRGCVTPRTWNLARQLVAQGWRLTCWDPHPWAPRSDHPVGLACDVYPGAAGVLPTAAQKAHGDALAASLQATAAQTGVNYIIWYGQIWSAGRASEGWRPYTSSTYDVTSVVGGHFDHLHVSLY